VSPAEEAEAALAEVEQWLDHAVAGLVVLPAGPLVGIAEEGQEPRYLLTPERARALSEQLLWAARAVDGWTERSVRPCPPA
jgi:hypothetical protein